MIWKISPLLKFEILVVFVNTSTASEKYPTWDCENFLVPFKEDYLRNEKLFLNFVHFQKRKENRHS